MDYVQHRLSFYITSKVTFDGTVELLHLTLERDGKTVQSCDLKPSRYYWQTPAISRINKRTTCIHTITSDSRRTRNKNENKVKSQVRSLSVAER
ncbi:hypothetical protein RSOLAG1IB_08524 [Rhizoctonia solani AG-1 IB]|uniref:Uncharacterized protein n=1 Tax=Thanatephorus cucumeris (strain AG1-IB / isolate 7/3/14) TaxID=1108050 RepID=A0A0B7FQI7_THACB|nr:hypothetical protein RSOLAG1IB_08524 [Rhizoctonia solani AG-1 IB]